MLQPLTIAGNIIWIARTFAEIVGWTMILLAGLVIVFEYEAETLEASGIFGFFSLAVLGWKVWLAVQKQRAETKAQRANTKAQQPLPEKKKAKPAGKARPTVAPFEAM